MPLLRIIKLRSLGPCAERVNSELIIYKKCEAQVKRYCLLNNNQGLEGHFRDPGKGLLLRKRDSSKFGRGMRDCLAVCWEFGKSYVLAVNANQLASVQWCVLSKQTINAFKKSTERTEDPLFQPDAKRVHLVLQHTINCSSFLHLL